MRTFSLAHRWNKIIPVSPVSVGAFVDVCAEYLTVDFAVREATECFCQSKEKDGEDVCQDSCVEIFLSLANGGYINFEFNSKGVCYAARGKNRQNREEFPESDYAQVIRRPSGVKPDGDFFRWGLSVQIPKELLGVKADLRDFPLEGNLYKCANLATKPHYLSAFPIDTPEPDFHQPNFFQKL
jgi:hypothetical protein